MDNDSWGGDKSVRDPVIELEADPSIFATANPVTPFTQFAQDHCIVLLYIAMDLFGGVEYLIGILRNCTSTEGGQTSPLCNL